MVSFTNKGPRAGKNPIRLFPYECTWFRITCHVTHYSNVPTLHSFNYVGNDLHQRWSWNTKMILSHGNNINSLIKMSIKTIVYFLQDLMVTAVLSRRLLCSQLHFTSDLLPVDHYGQEAKRGPLQEFLVHPSNLRPQKPFKPRT